MTAQHLARLVRSALYLRPSMIYWRIHRVVKSVLLRTSLGRAAVRRALRPGRVTPAWEILPPLSSRYLCEAIDIDARRVTFLNATVELPADPRDWPDVVRREPLLWSFHFCYHDWLPAVLRNGECSREECARALEFVDRWAAAFPPDARDARVCAWHPYVLSIRIEAWIRLAAIAVAAGIAADDARIVRLAAGVDAMTRVLLRNLEFGTMANHLMRNIKALVLAGVALSDDTGTRALRRGLALLAREIPEQILADGCHFERSPMYHASVLNDVQDMLETLARTGRPVPPYLADAQRRMTRFLDDILCPDGDVPYFNDSTRSFFLSASDTLARGKALDAEFPRVADIGAGDASDAGACAGSGLLVHRGDGLFAVFDAGDVGPRYQPGHAHCDTLSFEISRGGGRVVTDTGVYHYRPSAERAYCRSTAAHNTLSIDGEEQSEMWESFRVGRRARAIGCLRAAEDGLVLLRGAHDGFTRIAKGLVHERCLAIGGDAFVVVIDWVHGHGRHDISGRVHLHPDVAVRESDGVLHCAHASGDFDVIPPEGMAHGIIETEYYPRFGVKEPRSTIRFDAACALPAVFATVLAFEGAAPAIRLDSSDGKVQILHDRCDASIQPCFRSCTSST